jgi:hypothetical protein
MDFGFDYDNDNPGGENTPPEEDWNEHDDIPS